MDRNVFLQIGVNHGLEVLGHLKPFAIEDKQLLYGGKRFDLTVTGIENADFQHKIIDTIKQLVREKENILGTLQSVTEKLGIRDSESTKPSDDFELRAPPIDTDKLMNRLDSTIMELKADSSKIEEDMKLDKIIDFDPVLIPKTTQTHKMKDESDEDMLEGDEITKHSAQRMRSTQERLLGELLPSIRSVPNREAGVIKLLAQHNSELIDRLALELTKSHQQPEASPNKLEISSRAEESIARDYRKLVTEKRPGAMSILDGKNPEDQYKKVKHLFLTGIITVAEKEADNLYCRLVHDIMQQMKNPFISSLEIAINFQNSEHLSTKHTNLERRASASSVPEGLQQEIKIFLQTQIDDIEMRQFIKVVQNRVLKRYAEDKETTKKVLDTDEFQGYIEGCCHLAWRMKIQHSPMHFDLMEQDKPFNPEKLEIVHEAKSNKPSTVVHYYKYPTLMEGCRCLVKGAVYVE